MTRKHDRPFVEISCWIPIHWAEVARLLKSHPQFQVALRDAIQEVLERSKQKDFKCDQ